MKKDKLPKISIVTPSFNQGSYLEDTIQSILSQNYPKLEYIIIDGGSTDQSQKIISKYQDKLSYWAVEPDKGQYDAINKGFSRSSGEVMGWLNSDDVLRPGALILVGKIFAQLGTVNWLTSLPATINHHGYQLYLAQPPLYVPTFIRNGWYIRKLLGFIMQEGTFWRRNLWQKAGGKLANVEYSMDLKLWQEFAKYEDPVLLQTPLAAYRITPQQKNNDRHHAYYQEIGAVWPRWLGLPAKGLWRLVAVVAHCLGLSKTIYFSENDFSWYYRQPFKQKKKLNF
ncbi:MAG: glycosyltransferase [Candidatus Pacebacteria bacterium CG10_big_fil_rev_8_21_14_0_10_56_10]|nr:MAG: glycosyltransferase [Candidatus Pacebacteria bacterium CG10_big_fil_rev_8_21_14_0_10_56_10]